MKILTLHSDSLEVEPKTKALKQAEKVEKEKLHFDECLVVFSAVEQDDEKNSLQIAQQTAAEVKAVADQVKVKKIVLYPYVHLTSKPAKPHVAQTVLGSVENILKGKKLDVAHAPFGYYKAFKISVKGHPLAELSREIVAEKEIKATSKTEDVISGALKEEEKVKSSFYILSPGGRLTPAAKFDYSKWPNLEKFFAYERAKLRVVPGEPVHIKLMRKLEIADHEAGSDPGNLRFFPKGRLIKGLLEEWVTQKCVDYGAMEVETPVMYDFEHPALKDYLHRFPARQYVVRSAKKDFFLRFSACFGQFLTSAGMSISYKNLPLKMYELTRYSFRLEKAGELVGLRRLRAFTMPDMHTLCKDLTQAKEEFKRQFKLCMSSMADIGFKKADYETAIRFTKDFWANAKNKQFVVSLVKAVGKPVLIEIWNKRYAYFDPKFEFNFIDTMDRASALPTVQIDHENAQRYGIQFTDSDNKLKYPMILHASVSGSLERCIYALLEKAWLESEKGKNAILPLWLSPTQVRLCPVSEAYQEFCEKIAVALEKEQIRVDTDDRIESVQKKVRDAEVEWVPMAVVIGSKEKKSGRLAVRFRETGRVKSMKMTDLIKWIKKQIEGYPFKPLPLPKNLSKRPKFVG